MKKGVQKGVLLNMIWGLIFDAKMEGSEKQKQAFRLVVVAKHEFSRSHEI